jgi:hypothetical protein
MAERPADSVPEDETQAAKAATAFRKEHLKLELKGLRVADGLAILQIIRRLVKSGALEDYELGPIAMMRDRLIKRIQDETGVHYDAALLDAAKGARAQPRGRAASASDGKDH